MEFNEIASLLSWKICQGFPIPLSGTLLSFMDAQRPGNGLFMVMLSLCKTGGQVGVLGTANKNHSQYGVFDRKGLIFLDGVQ